MRQYLTTLSHHSVVFIATYKCIPNGIYMFKVRNIETLEQGVKYVQS